MRKAVAKLALLVWFAAGVLLYVANKQDLYPMAMLFAGLGLWLAIGLGAVVLSPRRNRNPFDKMTAAERRRVNAIVQNIGNNQKADPSDGAWLLALGNKYTPGLEETQQVAQFNAFLRRNKSATFEGVAPRQNLHKGPSVVLIRAQRRPDFDVTREGSSWFGGLPALGGQTWPTDTKGRLMTPLAQVDLSGLSADLQIAGLPETGSLAFFASLPDSGRDTGAVRYVPGPVGRPTPPGNPLPPVLNHSFGGAMRRGAAGADQTLYPRMAMDRVLIRADGAADPEAFAAEVDQQLGPGREVNLDPSLFKEVMPPRSQLYNCDSLLRFLNGARMALGDPKPAAMRKDQASFTASAKSLAA